MKNNDNNSISILPPLKNVLKVVKNKIWLIDFLNKNISLNEYFRTYELISRSVRVVEDNLVLNFIFDLRNNIFFNKDLTIISKVAFWLEKKGTNVERAEAKMGTTMSAFSMHWAFGDLEW